MSKSVDQTVLDYFSILLSEEVDEITATIESESTLNAENLQPEGVDGRLAPQFKKQIKVQHQVYKASHAEEPQLNKQALEELLAPVFKTEPVDVVIEAKAEIEIKQVVEAITEATVDVVEALEVVAEEVELEIVEPEVLINDELVTQLEIAEGIPPSITKDLQNQLDEEFQLLFFKVAGLILAVPLVNLGGIVQVEKVNQIFGRPNWFHGVQTHRDAQVNIVDTCAWVMPEKYDDTLAQSVNYQYLVVLEDSNWGLACESLVNTVKVDKSQVNWRSKPGKRPWLAGVVKQQMCGILNVEALIEMLNAGLGCQDPID